MNCDLEVENVVNPLLSKLFLAQFYHSNRTPLVLYFVDNVLGILGYPHSYISCRIVWQFLQNLDRFIDRYVIR